MSSRTQLSRISFACRRRLGSSLSPTESLGGTSLVTWAMSQEFISPSLRHMFFDGVFDNMDGMKYIEDGT